MAKVLDLTSSDGDYVILGRSLVLPSSLTDSQPVPLNGAVRFNSEIGAPQYFFAGAWITLGGGGGGSGGDGTSNNHTHSISQILGLQTALNNKANKVHTHELTEVAGLVGALQGKAPTVHQHSFADIPGLTQELAAKAVATHSHQIVIKDTIAGCFPGNPPALFNLVYVAGVPMSFPQSFAGSFVKLVTNPAATYTITLRKNADVIGTMVITPQGTTAFNVASALTLAAGDTLTFSLPARDIAINTISFTLVGARNSQTVS